MKNALCLLALIPFAAAGHPGQEGAKPVPCGTPKDAKLMDFRVPVSGSMGVEHVVLLEERVGCDLLLQFRKGNGLVVAGEGDTTSRPSMTLTEFTAALDGALSAIEKEHPEGHIGDIQLDQVQLDAVLVDELWDAVVAATKAEAVNLRGVVGPLNKRLVEAINRVLVRSRTVAASCAVLKSHSYVCDPGSVRQEAVAFKDGVWNKAWKGILPLPDAGLSEFMWLGIRVHRSDDHR